MHSVMLCAGKNFLRKVEYAETVIRKRRGNRLTASEVELDSGLEILRIMISFFQETFVTKGKTNRLTAIEIELDSRLHMPRFVITIIEIILSSGKIFLRTINHFIPDGTDWDQGC